MSTEGTRVDGNAPHELEAGDKLQDRRMRNINLIGLDRETLLIVAENACARLTNIANYLTTEEGDEDDTEEEFGIEASEVIAFAHDNIISDARGTLDNIIKKIETARAKVSE